MASTSEEVHKICLSGYFNVIYLTLFVLQQFEGKSFVKHFYQMSSKEEGKVILLCIRMLII